VKIKLGKNSYCAIHDPAYVAKRRAKRDAEWNREQDEREARETAAKAAADQHRREAEAFRWLEALIKTGGTLKFLDGEYLIYTPWSDLMGAGETLLLAAEAAMRKEPGK